ncbi:hypothetical protein BaRGS_00010749 [Batillaria attramentaria]|uniref:Uncharacterized protein n=1 Tax=Batillaria attramentaria TaxID=370345 RepID=A0ABD0LF52_9CAEN
MSYHALSDYPGTKSLRALSTCSTLQTTQVRFPVQLMFTGAVCGPGTCILSGIECPLWGKTSRPYENTTVCMEQTFRKQSAAENRIGRSICSEGFAIAFLSKDYRKLAC